MQFFIGLAEVLLGLTDNFKITHHARRPYAKELAMQLANHPEYAGIRLGCIGYRDARDEWCVAGICVVCSHGHVQSPISDL